MTQALIAKETTRIARKVLLLTLAGSVLLCSVTIGLSQLIAAHFSDQLARATDLHEHVEDVISARDKMRSAALMVARTQDPQWVGNYSAQPKALSQALTDLAAVVVDSSRRDFENILASVEALNAYERQIMNHSLVGNHAEAIKVATSIEYLQEDYKLATTAGRLLKSTDQGLVVKNANTKRAGLTMAIVCLAIAFLSAALIWRALTRQLDTTERAFSAAEGRIRWLAHTDPITGLSNRTAIYSRIVQSMIRTNNHGGKLALLLIDLDRFRPINARYGLVEGDRVLQAVGERIRSVCGDTIPCGRIASDEFIVLLEYSGCDSHVQEMAQLILDAIRQPMSLNDNLIELSSRVGIAQYPHEAETRDDLVAKADLALRKAKASGTGTKIAWFDYKMDNDLKLSNELAADLSSAIATGQIVPYFQPFVDLESGRLRGFEVLARWDHPIHGLIPPVKFIPLAETAGLSDPLMISLLSQACDVMRDLPRDLIMAINLSPAQIEDHRLPARILSALSRADFSPTRLEVELTESALVADIEGARRVINALGDIGIGLALDDFGTGYSNLRYLSDLPIGKIKIDRSFVKTVHDRAETVSVVNAVIALGRSLNAVTVAEGIEEARDADTLRAMGCTYGQGYFYSRPVPARALGELVDMLEGVPNHKLGTSA